MPDRNEREHLPLFGVGPIYAASVVGLTVLGIALSAAGIIPQLRADAASWSLRIVGALVAVGGVALWISAVVGSRIDASIEANHLVTTGAYDIVRNPIYSAFMLVGTGVILMYGNLALLVLPLAFWALMTAMMRATEEKWLLAQYGDEYAAYCERVNRCIPWFPKS